MLKPFTRDPSTPYSTQAEIEGFFQDFYEHNRMKLSDRKIAEKEVND